MPEWTRVRAKNGPAHEFSVRNDAVNPVIHEVLDKPGGDAYGRPLPAKLHVDLTPAAPTPPHGDTGVSDPPTTTATTPQPTDAGPTGSARKPTKEKSS